jgi:hypothetical protein
LKVCKVEREDRGEEGKTEGRGGDGAIKRRGNEEKSEMRR